MVGSACQAMRVPVAVEVCLRGEQHLERAQLGYRLLCIRRVQAQGAGTWLRWRRGVEKVGTTEFGGAAVSASSRSGREVMPSWIHGAGVSLDRRLIDSCRRPVRHA